jgi:hypothetical protein
MEMVISGARKWAKRRPGKIRSWRCVVDGIEQTGVEKNGLDWQAISRP